MYKLNYKYILFILQIVQTLSSQMFQEKLNKISLTFSFNLKSVYTM